MRSLAVLLVLALGGCGDTSYDTVESSAVPAVSSGATDGDVDVVDSCTLAPEKSAHVWCMENLPERPYAYIDCAFAEHTACERVDTRVFCCSSR